MNYNSELINTQNTENFRPVRLKSSYQLAIR